MSPEREGRGKWLLNENKWLQLRPICVIIFSFTTTFTFGTLELPRYYILIIEKLGNT